MSEPLFAVDEPEPQPEPTPPKVTERTMLDLLRRRYGKIDMGAHRYAVAEHVPDKPVFGASIADFIAVDCWRGSYDRTCGLDWSDPDGWGYPMHGHEVKVSRSDWLRELKDPGKAEAWRQFCDHWWLVVPDASIVRDDLPDGWGLLVWQGNGLRAVKRAPKLQRQPMPLATYVSLLRSVAKAARFGASGGLG